MSDPKVGAAVDAVDAIPILGAAIFEPDRDWPAGIHASVVQRIGRRIVNGELPPGAILPEQGELSRQLSVSRTVVREATRVLIAKGLVDSRPKRGTVVLPRTSWHILDPDILAWQTEAGSDPDFLRSIFEVRRIIEPGAARLAAERAHDDELQAMADAFEGMGRIDGDETSYYRADVQFHAIMVAASHNDYLQQLVATFGPALQAGLRATIRRQWGWTELLDFSLPLHRAVLDAVRARDPERADTAMQELVDGSRRGLEDHATAS